MNDDDELARRIGRALDRQTVDARTRERLRTARRRALDGDSAPLPWRWAPVGAVVVLALVVGAALLFRGEAPGALPDLAADELALIAAEEELELLEEWEFYAWFDAADDGSG